MSFPIPTLKPKCFSYQELKAIPILECNEPLVNVAESTLLCGEAPLKAREFVSHGMWVRTGILERLQLAQSELTKLHPTYHLHISYAYRHPEIQRRYFNNFFLRVKEEHPGWNQDELMEYTHHYMAIPEVGGHPAGAAVDLLIVERSDSKTTELRPIDMGSLIGDLRNLEIVPPVALGLSEEQQHNRLLLRHCMVAAGFAPYDFEWWHFSFGDREWACYHQQASAMYGEIEFRC